MMPNPECRKYTAFTIPGVGQFEWNASPMGLLGAPPNDITEVRAFLGLCNFFRGHVRNFAQMAAPLNLLTTNTCEWKGGPLPADAEKAFKELKSVLISEPVVHYPNPNLPYALITEACSADSSNPGGYSAILAQIRPDGEFEVISYASRKLKCHEKNYEPFLL